MDSFMASAQALFEQLDPGYKFIGVVFCGFVAAFHLMMPFYPSVKQRAWLLTSLGSSCMTLCSIPFIWDFVVNQHGDVSHLIQIPAISVTAARMFQAYLAADLFVGRLYYRSQINIVTGWGHHIVYMVLVDYLIRWGWSHIFILAGCMEIPTFHLAIASMHPRLRQDIVFAVLFFATRIAFHVMLFVSYLPKSTRDIAVQGSFLPSILFALAFPMHLMWFIGCLKGFIKRHKSRKAKAAAAASLTESEDEKKALLTTPAVMGGGGVTSIPPTPSFEKSLPMALGYTTSLKATTSISPSSYKAYPPSTQTLRNTSVPLSPTRPTALSPSVHARSISRARSSSLASPPLSPTSTNSRTPATFGNTATMARPALAPLRRRSLVSAEREESLRRLANRLADLAGDAIAVSPTMQSAVAVGRGMARTYRRVRGGRTWAGARRRLDRLSSSASGMYANFDDDDGLDDVGLVVATTPTPIAAY
ncbi:hypothetical protein DL93DRAFT_787437 [Clavulina sp. PMI_390]|nr:hypothetical protein DL93DRAFT_787437 [Clavulina sp. PMI_390]